MFLRLSPNPGHPTPEQKKKKKKNPRTIGFVQKQRLGGQLETARCSGPYLSSGLCFTSSTDIPKTNDQKMAEDPLSLDLRVIFIEPCRVPSFCQNLLTPRTQRLYVHFRGIALSLSLSLSFSLSPSLSHPLSCYLCLIPYVSVRPRQIYIWTSAKRSLRVSKQHF